MSFSINKGIFLCCNKLSTLYILLSIYSMLYCLYMNKEPVKCPCGKEFSTTRSDFWSYLYCSEECLTKYETEKEAERIEREFYKQQQREAPSVCPCGKEFRKYDFNANRIYKVKYCSNECRKNFFNQRNISLSLRFKILNKYHFTCQYCGRKAPEVVLNVEHIKPVIKYPELKNDPNNLTVACFECNHGKMDSELLTDNNKTI